MRIEVTVLTEGGVEDEDAKYCTLSVELDGCAGSHRCWPLQPNSFDGWSQATPAQASVHGLGRNSPQAQRAVAERPPPSEREKRADDLSQNGSRAWRRVSAPGLQSPPVRVWNG